MQIKNKYKPKPSAIFALCIISESELAKVIPNYSYSLEEDQIAFNKLLYSLGLDIDKPYSRQDAIQHRNRFNEIVVCSRWVGEERVDDRWIQSGYASKEAIDKASGSKILEDIYRSKYLTIDAQEMLESRDRYSTQEEDE